MKIHTIVLHYSATYPETPVTRQIVDRWHRDRGFREFGYHWLIRRDGTLEEGRPEETMGAHVRGYNSGTIGICWAGGLDRKTGPDVGVWNPTDEQTKTMVELIRNIQKRHPSAQRVVGHKDLVPTECPGLPRGGVEEWWAMHGGKVRTKSESTTLRAASAQIAAGAATAATGLSTLDGNAQIVVVLLAAVVISAAAWVMRERLRKWAQGDH